MNSSEQSDGRFIIMKVFTRSERAFIDALYSILQKKHISEVHVTDLLRLSGYTKGAFYGRFEDINDFIRKIILQSGAVHQNFLNRSAEIAKAGLDADSPESMRNATEFFQFVYDYQHLYDMIIDHKLCQNSLELFLFGEKVPDVSESTHTPFPDGQTLGLANAFFGVYTSIIYILFWRSIGYDNLGAKDIARIITPIKQKIFDHFSEMQQFPG